MDENTTMEQVEQTEQTAPITHDDAKTEEKKTKAEFKPTIEKPFAPDELKIIVDTCKQVYNTKTKRKFVKLRNLVNKVGNTDEHLALKINMLFDANNLNRLSNIINSSTQSVSDEEKNKIKADIEAKRTELNELKKKLASMEKPPVYTITK